MINFGNNFNYNPCENTQQLNLNQIINNIENQKQIERNFIGYDFESEELCMEIEPINFQFNPYTNQIEPIII